MPLDDMENNPHRNKNKVNDRIIVLKVKEGSNALSSTGLVDNRLFSGENRLHGVFDETSCLWYMKYDEGSIPPVLRQKFTSFPRLLKCATEYFNKRNVEVKEVID